MAGLPQLVGAAQQFSGDKYSQSRRWEKGYSDCSSFVCKSLKLIGIPYPTGGTTVAFLASPDWSTIPRSQLSAGDICVNATHMAIAIDNQTGIGQENPRRNVVTGPIDSLFYGTGPYRCMRYVGSHVAQADFGTGSSGVLQTGFSAIPSAIVDTAKWLSDTINWLRIGMVLAGAILIGMTLFGLRMGSLGKVLKNG